MDELAACERIAVHEFPRECGACAPLLPSPADERGPPHATSSKGSGLLRPMRPTLQHLTPAQPSPTPMTASMTTSPPAGTSQSSPMAAIRAAMTHLSASIHDRPLSVVPAPILSHAPSATGSVASAASTPVTPPASDATESEVAAQPSVSWSRAPTSKLPSPAAMPSLSDHTAVPPPRIAFSPRSGNTHSSLSSHEQPPTQEEVIDRDVTPRRGHRQRPIESGGAQPSEPSPAAPAEDVRLSAGSPWERATQQYPPPLRGTSQPSDATPALVASQQAASRLMPREAMAATAELTSSWLLGLLTLAVLVLCFVRGMVLATPYQSVAAWTSQPHIVQSPGHFPGDVQCHWALPTADPYEMGADACVRAPRRSCVGTARAAAYHDLGPRLLQEPGASRQWEEVAVI